MWYLRRRTSFKGQEDWYWSEGVWVNEKEYAAVFPTDEKDFVVLNKGEYWEEVKEI